MSKPKVSLVDKYALAHIVTTDLQSAWGTQEFNTRVHQAVDRWIHRADGPPFRGAFRPQWDYGERILWVAGALLQRDVDECVGFLETVNSSPFNTIVNEVAFEYDLDPSEPFTLAGMTETRNRRMKTVKGLTAMVVNGRMTVEEAATRWADLRTQPQVTLQGGDVVLDRNNVIQAATMIRLIGAVQNLEMPTLFIGQSVDLLFDPGIATQAWDMVDKEGGLDVKPAPEVKPVSSFAPMAEAQEMVLRAGVRRLRDVAGARIARWWTHRQNPQQEGETTEAWEARLKAQEGASQGFLAGETGQSLVALVLGFAWRTGGMSVTDETIRVFGDAAAKELMVSAGSDLLDGLIDDVFRPVMQELPTPEAAMLLLDAPKETLTVQEPVQEEVPAWKP